MIDFGAIALLVIAIVINAWVVFDKCDDYSGVEFVKGVGLVTLIGLCIALVIGLAHPEGLVRG